jgi:hypothetical protein
MGGVESVDEGGYLYCDVCDREIIYYRERVSLCVCLSNWLTRSNHREDDVMGHHGWNMLASWGNLESMPAQPMPGLQSEGQRV